ncbi:helix-hairpin-helix domain-containing protein [uncultured Nocardioides sp.]|uniref:helix-hairpin-helix domain-containing protein n=1 Tax=uncultured Nocardioides sp. TaxID=198441 RepID=UPI002633885A|nr:helix-hairpin-helix domain-containing protein [uncultured Nocardioides sp.]
MMLRPAVTAGIRDGVVDLAFRRWERPRVKVGTRLRTGVGVVEVTSLEQVPLASLRAEDATRAGHASLAELRAALEGRPGPVWRVGVAYGGADPREALREQVPDEAGLAELRAQLDRLDRASSYGAWTREALRLIDEFPGRRAPELAEMVGRPTPEFKTDVRKLKEKGLTISLDIGYRLSPRGAAVLGVAPPELAGTPLPKVGAPASRALTAAGITTLEDVEARSLDDIAALHGVGPVAVARLREALASRPA